MSYKIGYIRVSALDQHDDRQIIAIEAEKCNKIYREKQSGKNMKDRPVFNEMLASLRPGDTLVAKSFSRLFRNTKELLITCEDFKKRGIKLYLLDMPFIKMDGTAMDTLFISMIGAFDEFQRAIQKEAQAEGIAAAKIRWQKNPSLSRPGKRIDTEFWLKIGKRIQKNREDGFTISDKEIRVLCGCSSGAFYKIQKFWEAVDFNFDAINEPNPHLRIADWTLEKALKYRNPKSTFHRINYGK